MSSKTKQADFTGTVGWGTSIGVRPGRNMMGVITMVSKGLPFRALELFLEQTGMTLERAAELIDVAPSTILRRKASRQTLRPRESERLFRFARLWELATELFEGDRAAASRWLGSKHAALANKTPLEIAQSELGAREVENLMGRLEHGVFS